MKNSLYLLWLEGIDPQNLAYLPGLEKYIKQGVDLHLSPLPLVEQGQCYYQLMTGMGSGKFGRFDAVYPQGYMVYPNNGTPEGALGHLLPDLLRQRNASFLSIDVDASDDLAALQGQPDVVLIRIPAAGALANDQLNNLIERCLERITLTTYVMVLTDVWHPTRSAHVNINDFLADIGLLEVGETRTKDAIVWSETLAYGLGKGQIWINMRGREPQGAVSAGREYQEVCDALINGLKTHWVNPQTGEPIVEQVFKREELYEGDYLFKAPDLITVYRPGYEASPKAVLLDFDGESVHVLAPAAAIQGPFARVIASGPALLSGQRQEARLTDVLPTILYLLGQTIPSDIDGKALVDICTTAYREQVPVRYADENAEDLSDEEEGMIVDRLRDLGYLG